MNITNANPEQKPEQISLSLALKKFVSQWQDKPGSLIMILHRVQEEYGYIPATIIEELALILNISQGTIYGVVTFYHFFKLKKPGEHVISVCTGTACYLQGADAIIEELKKQLHIDIGEVTVDGKFSLEAVRCLGCCGLAPVISIGEQVFGRVKPKQIKDILKKIATTSH